VSRTKLRTVFKSRLPDKAVTKRDRLLVSAMLTFNIVMDSIIPFVFGFYFCYTQSIIFLLLFVLSLVFSVELLPENNKVTLRIWRVI